MEPDQGAVTKEPAPFFLVADPHIPLSRDVWPHVGPVMPLGLEAEDAARWQLWLVG